MYQHFWQNQVILQEHGINFEIIFKVNLNGGQKLLLLIFPNCSQLMSI